jgi:hypothetical protein
MDNLREQFAERIYNNGMGISENTTNEILDDFELLLKLFFNEGFERGREGSPEPNLEQAQEELNWKEC